MVQTRIADHEKRMLRLVALSVRRRLLRAGTAAVSAPRVSSLAAVDIRPSPFLRHADTSRCFSSQTEDDDDADGSWTTLALSSPVAWREAAKPALLAFLKVETHLMVPVAFTVPYETLRGRERRGGIRWASTLRGCGSNGEREEERRLTRRS